MKKKTADAVAKAKAFEEEAFAAMIAARKDFDTAEEVYRAAIELTREARIAADSELPQCNMVVVGWGGKESDSVPVVILRKTPKGMLCVRRVGSDDERKFRFYRNLGFVQAWKKISLYSGEYRLRDVPKEFMPDTDNK